MNLESVNLRHIENATSAIVAKIIPELNSNSADDLHKMLLLAAMSQEPISIVAISCINWKIPDHLRGSKTDWIVKPLESNNKRLQRLSNEFACLQHSLDSLNVPHNIHFSASNTEIAMHIRLGNLGSTIHNSDPNEALELANQATENAVVAFKRHSVRVSAFDHLNITSQIIGTNNLEDIQREILQGRHHNEEEFLHGQYLFDLKRLLKHFRNTDRATHSVFIDCSSGEFDWEVNSLNQAASELWPRPITIRPFNNAGNWNAKPTPEAIFPDKESIIQSLLHTKSPPTAGNFVSWGQKQPDKTIREAIDRLSGEKLASESDWEWPDRNTAIGILGTLLQLI
jgi:hypothetical protein